MRALYSVSITASTLVTTSFTSPAGSSFCDYIIDLGDAYSTWEYPCFERIRFSRTDNITGGGELPTEDRKPDLPNKSLIAASGVAGVAKGTNFLKSSGRQLAHRYAGVILPWKIISCSVGALSVYQCRSGVFHAHQHQSSDCPLRSKRARQATSDFLRVGYLSGEQSPKCRSA